MKAEFRQIKHTLWAQFTRAGAPDDLARVAAVAMARRQVYGVVPNPEQEQAIAQCQTYSFKPLRRCFTLSPFTLLIWFRQRQINRHLDAQILEGAALEVSEVQ